MGGIRRQMRQYFRDESFQQVSAQKQNESE